MSGNNNVVSDVPFGNNEWISTKDFDAKGGHLGKPSAEIKMHDFNRETLADTLKSLITGEQNRDSRITRAVKILHAVTQRSSAEDTMVLNTLENKLRESGIISDATPKPEVQRNVIALALRGAKRIVTQEELLGKEIPDADLPSALKQALGKINLSNESSRAR